MPDLARRARGGSRGRRPARLRKRRAKDLLVDLPLRRGHDLLGVLRHPLEAI
jgi:hypothetical protein